MRISDWSSDVCSSDLYMASLIWNPIDYVRFMVNYARLQYSDAVIPAGGDRSYGVDSFGARAQVVFWSVMTALGVVSCRTALALDCHLQQLTSQFSGKITRRKGPAGLTLTNARGK